MSFQPSLSKSRKPTPKPRYLRLTPRPAPEAGVVEGAVAVVAVESRHLVGEVGADDVEPAVAVVVGDADAHAGEGDAVLVERAAGGDADLAEGAVVVVAVEQARRGVAGDVDVGPAVVVEIAADGAHAVRSDRPPVLLMKTTTPRAARIRDARLLGDILERAVAAIAVEEVGAAGKPVRSAGHRNVVVAAVGGFARQRRAAPGRSSRSWRRTDRDGRRGRSRGNSIRRPSGRRRRRHRPSRRRR